VAFYFALKDTLLCPNINIATDIAFGAKRRRVVTLDGNLIEMTGMMSGGGRKRKGGMSFKSDNETS